MRVRCLHVFASALSHPMMCKAAQHMLMCLCWYNISSCDVPSSTVHADNSLLVQCHILWHTKQHSTCWCVFAGTMSHPMMRQAALSMLKCLCRENVPSFDMSSSTQFKLESVDIYLPDLSMVSLFSGFESTMDPNWFEKYKESMGTSISKQSQLVWRLVHISQMLGFRRLMAGLLRVL